ncbi:hypothetical protein UlMin_005690 [Ulmus minor]
MYLMRKKIQKFPDIFPTYVAILDDYWTQSVDGRYEAAVEKNELQSFWCPEDLIHYCRGERPIHGTSWEAFDFLFGPLNITNTHWVAMVIDIPKWYIYIFDSNPLATGPENMKDIVKPFVHLVPKILKQIGLFDHLVKVRDEVPFQYSQALDKVPIQVTSGECGVFTYKFLEMYMMKVKLQHFSDDHCFSVRKRLTSKIFARDMDL